MTSAARRVDAVTFDYWDTLMHVEGEALRDRRLTAWLDIFEARGMAAEPRRLEEAHHRAFLRYQECWRGNLQFCVPDAVEEMIDALGLSADESLRASLVEAFTAAGLDTVLHPAEGLEDCLRALSDGGIRIGIVCDVGLTPSPVLVEHLRRQGLLRWFDSWTFSDEVGVYKPEPVIFAHALRSLGDVDPARAAHVGDRRRTDVGGAYAMGMLPVRYAGIFDDRDAPEPDAPHVVGHHRELAAIVGVG